MADSRTHLTGRMVLGLVVMALGALWTLDNLDLLESEPIVRWWPLVVVAAGVAKLTGVGTHRNVAAGLIFSTVGVWLLAESLGFASLSPWGFWPLILVAIGFNLVVRSMGRQRVEGPADEPSSHVSTFAFWSGVDRKVTSQEFRVGEVTAVMGGVDMDFRQAKPAPGGGVLDVFVWWGGIDLRVPDHWRVVNEATVLMGAIEDKSKAPPADAVDVLIVRGLVVMGGVEIKN